MRYKIILHGPFGDVLTAPFLIKYTSAPLKKSAIRSPSGLNTLNDNSLRATCTCRSGVFQKCRMPTIQLQHMSFSFS